MKIRGLLSGLLLVPGIFFFRAGLIFPVVIADQNLQEKFDGLARPLLERKYAVGIIIGVIEGEKTRFFSYGGVSAGSKQAPDEKTVFEIGSLTKTFTALLLADLVQKGLLSLDDPIRKFRPVSIPRKGKKEITLEALATHTSSLPRIPANFEMSDPYNPYSDYTVAKLYDFLSAYRLPRVPGEKYEYSNLGSGLLGHVLSRREEENYETLVRERICRPLGMQDTGIELPAEQRGRLAQGYDLGEEPVPIWDFPVLAGCGALRSTARDMVIYLRANLGLIESPLVAALTATHRPRHSSAIPGWEIGLGWHVDRTGTIGWHDGGTGGFYAYAGFDRNRRFGFIWLSNASLWQVGALRERLDDILLDKPVRPLILKKAVKLKPALLQDCVGEYRFPAGKTIKVHLEDGVLILGDPGKTGGSVLYPESETSFFFLSTETVTVCFDRDERGKVRKLIFREEGEEAVHLEKILRVNQDSRLSGRSREEQGDQSIGMPGK